MLMLKGWNQPPHQKQEHAPPLLSQIIDSEMLLYTIVILLFPTLPVSADVSS